MNKAMTATEIVKAYFNKESAYMTEPMLLQQEVLPWLELRKYNFDKKQLHPADSEAAKTYQLMIDNANKEIKQILGL